MGFDRFNIPIGPQASLPDKMTVLVTGAASGIGLAQAQSFLKAGHTVIGVDIKENRPLNKTTNNQAFTYYTTDVSDEKAVKNLYQSISQHHSSLHVLVNTAGILDDYRTIEETSFEDWQKVLNTNLQSIFLMTKTFLPLLLKNPTSRLINMSSIAGLTAGGGGIAYTASKHAVAGFTKQMAYDYAEHGLLANAIAPGAIATDMNKADFEIDEAAMAMEVRQQTPNKRWATAQEVADLTSFLASNQASYIQGSVIPIDGGWLIR